MPVVAIAGGTGSLGRFIVEETIADDNFEVIILGRKGVPNLKTYLDPLTIVLHIPARKAAIPRNPDQHLVFTYTKDIAKFTAKLLTLDKWDPVSYIIGDRLTWKEFMQLTEENLAGDRFDITYDSLEQLKSGKVTELPGHKLAYPFYPKEAL
ncbi:isoflavone reductase like P3 [Fusarium coicis]|nr:isoflavone reductase like P3 [Fusarium coicis]